MPWPRASWVALISVLSAAPLASAAKDSAVPVTLAQVTAQVQRDQVVLTGSSVPWRRAELSPRVEGLVTEVLVDEGSLVAAGDAILVLDAQLAMLELEAARARAQETEAARADAIRVRDELLELKKGRHASEAEIQSAVAKVEMAAASLRGERAAVARAEELVARHRLAAPFAGMVVAKGVEVGEWVQRDEAAVELVAMDRLRVRAVLPQRDYPRIAAGADATLRFDALPEKDFTGKVLARVALGDPRSRTFPVLIDLPNPDRLLAPGMSARVRLGVDGEVGEVLTIPRDAVVAKSDGTREVWRIKTDEGVTTAWPLRVETGRAFGDRLEIVAGALAEGDRLVMLGNEQLRPGQEVLPQGDSAETAALE
ncbi:efflux RND transporter periplasmic adaptor subunit [Thiorhodococcus minor]|uniref:Efflux RND transporter periplasmic adaptor subunit n=1 Tax=Thiorhodococcus minor TaxID=57489 RepID=A0A6M0K8W1_9GAMM|nr:efflux RND transporter periplasmic adaptor subunit [Thiorhodococcus minor]NEV64865.1 efflux RND transporter periplasmic adaptor subunit [Thiorhodococcus minor]